MTKYGGSTPAETFCIDCETCRDCTVMLLRHFMDVLASIGLALLQVCTSLIGVALAVAIMAAAAFALLRH